MLGTSVTTDREVRERRVKKRGKEMALQHNSYIPAINCWYFRMVVRKTCQNFQDLKVILEQFHDQILQQAAEESYFR